MTSKVESLTVFIILVKYERHFYFSHSLYLYFFRYFIRFGENILALLVSLKPIQLPRKDGENLKRKKNHIQDKRKRKENCSKNRRKMFCGEYK